MGQQRLFPGWEKIGEWKKEMKAFHIHLYKIVYQEELEKLKYESNKNWG